MGGPSTTTLTKIEAGAIKSLRRRTMADLDHVLGWRVESTEALLYSGAEPRVVRKPDRTTPPSGIVIEPPQRPEGASEEQWFVSQGATDSLGRHVVVGTLATTDEEGVQTIAELRYWPGADNRLVSMASFPGAVVEAHRLALEATNIYRAPKETPDAQSDPAPSTRAGGSPAPEVPFAQTGDVSDVDYTLAARAKDDDAESEAQQIDP